MKKLTTAILIVMVALLSVTLFASAGAGWCVIPQAKAASSAAATATTLHVEGMTCGSCATAVKHVLKKVDGVKDARVSYEEKQAVVTYDANKVTPEQIARAVGEKLAGYKATVAK